MRTLLVLFLLATTGLTAARDENSFREQQLKYPRVRIAAKDKDQILRKKFESKGVLYPPRAILLRAFKKEGLLELWAAEEVNKKYSLMWTYKICATSGALGPKRRFGDEQVPEGFYFLDWFNPQSNFFLSLHVSYPNAADRVLGSRTDLGGDIFLHGNCVTIGCLPITDDGIKEVYWLAVLARASGQRNLPIHIFPARLTDEGYRALIAAHPAKQDLIPFWSNLKQGFDYFERTHKEPRITVSRDGSYSFLGVN